MRRRWRLVTAVVFLIGGLAVLLIFWRPWQPPRSFVTAEELGYVIEYEVDPATLSMHGSNPDRAGEEFVSVVVQGHYSMQIVVATLANRPRSIILFMRKLLAACGTMKTPSLSARRPGVGTVPGR